MCKNKKNDKKYLLYMLLSVNTNFYIDVTTEDIMTIFNRHVRGEIEKTKGMLPVFMVYEEYFDNEKDALTKLRNIKKMNQNRRMKFIRAGLKNYIGDWVEPADKIQLLLHKKHGINAIRYLKENPYIDYIHCFNPNCPEGCKDEYAVISKSDLIEHDRPTKKTLPENTSLKHYEVKE